MPISGILMSSSVDICPLLFVFEYSDGTSYIKMIMNVYQHWPVSEPGQVFMCQRLQRNKIVWTMSSPEVCLTDGRSCWYDGNQTEQYLLRLDWAWKP